MSRRNCEALFEKYALSNFDKGMKVFEIAPERQLHIKKTIDNKVGMNKYDYYYTDIDDEEMMKIINDEYNRAETELDKNNYIKALSEYKFDVEDNTFDIVYSNNVSEHVRWVWVWMEEIYRILKPGGIVITHNPFTEVYHEAPIDCWRIFPEGFNSLYSYAGFVDMAGAIEHIKLEDDGMKHFDTIAIAKKPEGE